MPLRRSIAVLAATLTLIGLGAASCVTRDEPPPPLVEGTWSECPVEGLYVEADCTTVSVPKDWLNPGTGTFSIAVMRIPATDQEHKTGSIIMNPGGPGGSGLEFLAGFGPYLTTLREHFDLVSFDPRGVGQSDPLDCYADADLQESFAAEPDATGADFDALVALTQKMVDGCAAKYGDDLRYISTEQTARDMEAVRVAVGDERMNYLGFSYGTLLGAVYAELFPTTIRAMVLDGAVDPTQSAVASTEGQAMGFERALDNFSAWCKGAPDECPIAPDARAAITAAIDGARATPQRAADGREVTPGMVFWGVVGSLYVQWYWPQLAKSIVDLGKGDPAGIVALADDYARRDPDGGFDNIWEANIAVNCVDGPYPSLAEIQTLQSQWREDYPLFGGPLALGLIGCTLWPQTNVDPFPVGAAVGAPPIVVVGTLGDPATPYENTEKLATMLGTGRVITWEGEGHTAYAETPCITDAVDAFFIDLTLPADGLRCPA